MVSLKVAGFFPWRLCVPDLLKPIWFLAIEAFRSLPRRQTRRCKRENSNNLARPKLEREQHFPVVVVVVVISIIIII